MMNVFMESISRVFKGAAGAFQTFPAAIGCALGFAIVTMIRIQLDWSQQEPYNFLFNCLHWSFALGSIFSLAAITAAQSRWGQAKAFLAANLLGGLVVITAFLALYFLGAADEAGTAFQRISTLAAARVCAAMLVSFLAFVWLAGYPPEKSDFACSFFMTHKAFFIAATYGLVVMGGLEGVAGAIQALLYQDMSEKVYMYIATLGGFLAFTIFAGYFPDFRHPPSAGASSLQAEDRRRAAQEQPRFIEILFGYIMVPIVLALTAVLLLWAGKTMLTGMGSSFAELSSIATSYALAGLWLHIMVTHHDSGLARFYRRVFPIAALVILAFEAWALVVQLQASGLKLAEYGFAAVWIIAVAAAVMLLLRQERSHAIIAALAAVMAIVVVLPVIGYHALPVSAQVSRLEALLTSQGMLEEGQIIPAAEEPGLEVREAITDAVEYLAYAEDAELPDWFDRRLGESTVFKARMGFEQAWPEPATVYPRQGTMGMSLVLRPEPLDITGYRWAVNMQNLSNEKRNESNASIQGAQGSYLINWKPSPPGGIPLITVTLDDRVILEEDMKAYADRLAAAYPPGQAVNAEAGIEDMSLLLETPEASFLLVFSNVDIYLDPQNDVFNYWFNLNTVYMQEKPVNGF